MLFEWKSSFVQMVKDVYNEFVKDQGFLSAAAIAFYGLLSLLPLMLLVIAAFGFVIGRETALQEVLASAKEFLPAGADELEKLLREISRESSVLGGLGLLGLLWTGSQVFVIIQHVMNVALGTKKKISFIRTRLMALGMVIVVGLLFALSIGITSLLAAIRDFNVSIDSLGTANLELIWDISVFLLTMVISVLAFAFAYHFLPAENTSAAGAWVGGIVAGLLFEIAKYAFRWYVANVSSFSRVYGPLGGVVMLISWIFYVSLIAVVGAEVASVYARRNKTAKG